MPPNYFRALQRGSSPVDWCEANYVISPVIAEFVNTISNAPFLVFPLVQWYLLSSDAHSSHRSMKVVWFLNGLVGICSMYFHATLSLAGQLLDELAILWLVTAGFCLWMPKRILVSLPFWAGNRKPFQVTVVILCGVGTILSLFEPAINAFVLMVFGLPITVVFIAEMKRCHNSRVVRLCYRVCAVWFVALFCWLTDRLFCEVWSSISFPYMHGAWHVLMAMTAYSVCIIFAYFEAFNEAPENLPAIKFWPNDRFEWAIPYVVLNAISIESQKIL